MEVTIALAQMMIALGRPDRNFETAHLLATQAANQGAQVLILPELWPTGYDLTRAEPYATPLDQGVFSWMARLARAHQFYVIGSALETNPHGPPFNTAALYAPDGALVGAYRKVHLIPLMDEPEHLAAGDSLPVFHLPWGRLAISICYDLRFPEQWRRYMDAGAGLVLIPAEWPMRRIEHWRLLLRARAVENQFFVAGCNRAGSDADGQFGGGSAVVDPWGRVLVEGGSEPGLFVATLNLDEVARCRRLFPFLDDRRPEVYAP